MFHDNFFLVENCDRSVALAFNLSNMNRDFWESTDQEIQMGLRSLLDAKAVGREELDRVQSFKDSVLFMEDPIDSGWIGEKDPLSRIEAHFVDHFVFVGCAGDGEEAAPTARCRERYRLQ